jgi:hypothetical protein
MTFESLGGYCKSPNLFIRNTSRPDPDGILSETIYLVQLNLTDVRVDHYHREH